MKDTTEKRSVGATLKYAALIATLEDDTLYTAAMISHLDEEVKSGFLRHNRICKSLGFFSRYHGMSDEPDGYVKQYKAWFGRTWKHYVKPEDFDAAERAPAPQKQTITLPLWGFALTIGLTISFTCFAWGMFSGLPDPGMASMLEPRGENVQERVRALAASYRRNRLRRQAQQAALADITFPAYSELEALAGKRQSIAPEATPSGAPTSQPMLLNERLGPSPSPP